MTDSEGSERLLKLIMGKVAKAPWLGPGIKILLEEVEGKEGRPV